MFHNKALRIVEVEGTSLGEGGSTVRLPMRGPLSNPSLLKRWVRYSFGVGVVVLQVSTGLLAAQEVGPIDGASSQQSDRAEMPTPDSKSFVLTRVNLVPMDSPRVLRDREVLVQGDRIQGIGSIGEFSNRDGMKVIDGDGGYLLPGLTDAHVHQHEALGARPDFGDAPLYFSAGITSIVNLGGDASSLDLRHRIQTGEVIAPHFYTSGEFINEPLVTSPDEVAQEVIRQVESGVDILKFHEISTETQRTTVGLSREGFHRMVQTARELGVPLVGHTPHNLGLGAVLEARQSLAHLNALIEYDLLPDPSARFQAYAKTTKWSCLTLLVLAALILAWLGICCRGDFLLMAIAMDSILLGAVFLFVWEHTFWSGSNPLIYVLLVLGLAFLFLAIICVGLILRRSASMGRRVGLAALLVPLTVILFSLTYWLPLAWHTSNGELGKLADSLRESGISIITTLVVDSGVTPEQFESWYKYLPEGAAWVGKSYPYEPPPFYEPNLKVARWSVLEKVLAKKLHEGGVPLIAGTDSMGFPLMVAGIAMHRELELLIEAGLSPYETLRTATVAPAILLGEEKEFGTLEVGKRADLLLVKANPLEGIATLSRPQGLCVGGLWFTREQLDSRLARLAEKD